MLKRFKTLAIAAAATALMSASAYAAPVIDFTTGLAGQSGTITWDGSNYIGSNIGIGVVTIVDADMNNGAYTASGTNTGGFATLNFDTHSGSNFFNISGCIPSLSVGGLNASGQCTSPVTLASGTFTSFDHNYNRGLQDVVATGGIGPELLEAIGFSPDLPWEYIGFSTTTRALSVGGTGSALSTDITANAVPEPATMMLLGTGLLAAFRARRRNA